MTDERKVIRKPIAPPDLHDWIRRFGSYAAITPQGWAEYDVAMAAWRERHRTSGGAVEDDKSA